MSTYLLDASVLIAFAIEEHDNHDQAVAWVRGIDRFAVCPIVEGALVRSLIRLGGHSRMARETAREVRSMARCEFWPDSVSYADVPLDHVQGHGQVTDAYLAALAASRGALLATLDQGLAATLPERVHLIA